MAQCFGVSVYLEGMPLLAVQGTIRISVFGVNKDAYAPSYLLQGVAEICSMIRGLDDWLGWACSFPATGPGPGWCLDTEVGAVMFFFFLPPHQQRFPKKEIFPVLLRAVLVDRRDEQQGSRPAASNRPPESQAVQALLSNSCLQHLDHIVLI